MKLLNIQKEIPDILLDIRYCTTYNFIGEIIDGYIDPVALGTKELVKQLKVINSKARQMGYRLKIWDAYRPQSALDHFMTWKDTEDDKMKSIFYPKYSKSYLFENDFIIEKSAHTRSSTVDLTLVDEKTGKEFRDKYIFNKKSVCNRLIENEKIISLSNGDLSAPIKKFNVRQWIYSFRIRVVALYFKG